MGIDRSELVWLTDKSDGCMKKTVSNEKLKRILKDFNFIEIDEGLRITYEWFKANYKNIRC